MRVKTGMWLCVALIGVLGGQVLGAEEEAGPQREAVLETSRGGTSRLSTFRGKPVVLFFESRDSADLNKPFKDRLFAIGRERHLLEAAHVVAVADLTAFDFFPARRFAQDAVRKEEDRWNIPILIDWKGTLTSAPWNLPKDTSSVVLLDAEGRVVYEKSGRLADADQRAFFERLASMLGVSLE